MCRFFELSVAKYTTFSLLILTTSTAARAADLLPPAPEHQAASNWTGPSLGLNVTNLWSTGSLDVPQIGKLNGFSLNGPGAGLTLGYDYQIAPAVVIGGAADLNVSASQFSASVPGESLVARNYASWALRGRLGTEIAPGTLAYGTVGFSQMFGDASLNGAVAANSGRQTFNGAVFGLGIETQFDTNMFARIEYLHGVYGKQSYAGGLFNITPSTDSARFSLVFRPGDGAPASAAAAEPANWGGFYVGGMGGWENARGSASVSGYSLAGIGGGGPSGAAVAGFNVQSGKAVAGVEGELSVNGARASATDVLGDEAHVSVSQEAALRARFGALVWTHTMLYGAIGGVYTHGDASATFAGIPYSAGSDFGGVQYGLGVETMLTPHIGVRVEYLESRYAASNHITPSLGKTQSGLIYKF